MSPGWPLEALTRGLLLTSCLYLALPYVIFFVGWLKWWAALPAVILLGLPVCYTARTIRPLARGSQADGDSAVVRWHHLLLVLIAALVLSGLSGTGGYGAQDSDHPKHNAILKCLIDEPWPATVESDRGSFPLVYYVAWYLPAALFGKMAGWEAANHLWQIWTLLGLVLSLLWFCVLCRRVSWLVLGVFVFFSGLDVVGASLLKFLAFTARPDFDWRSFDWGSIDWVSLRWWNWQLRWWNVPALRNYSSNVALLFFVPQQALAGWMLAGVVAEATLRNSGPARRTLVFYCALSALWSPFVTIGLAPLLVFDLLQDKRGVGPRLRDYVSLPNLCGLGIFAPVALYYLARFAHFPFAVNPSAGFGFGSPLCASTTSFVLHLLLFLVLEVGIVAWLVWRIAPFEDRRVRQLFVATLAFLLLLPLFRYGAMNDLVMRASIPCLFVFAAFVARALLRKEAGRSKRAILVGILALAAANPVAEIYRHLRAVHAQGGLLSIPAENELESLWSMNRNIRQLAVQTNRDLLQAFQGDTFFVQYLGSPDSLFFRHLARPRSQATEKAAEGPVGLSERATGCAVAARP